jgi:2-polyprenyl-6-methoxyphenol hydroxylase-like FAD-dependent oxidoreductase
VLLRPAVPDFGLGLDHMLAVRRSHLYGVLLAAVEGCPAITMRLGVEVTRAHPDGRVEICGPSGTWVVAGEVVVGADGVGSTVRDHGGFGASVHPSGAHYVLGLVPGVLRRLRDGALRGVGRAQGWMDRQARSVQQEDPAWLYAAVRTLTDEAKRLAGCSAHESWLG